MVEDKPRKVEELQHFPFSSFEEFQKKVREGVAILSVDRAIALQWVQGGKYCSGSTRLIALILASMQILTAIGLIVYIIMTQTWWLFLGLPVLFIGGFIFHPSSAMIFGPIRSLLIFLTFVGLVWGFVSEIAWLTALMTCLILIWFSTKKVYDLAVNGVLGAAIEHEDLLCILWNSKMMSVTLYNGDRYFRDWKQEGGESVHYDREPEGGSEESSC